VSSGTTTFPAPKHTDPVPPKKTDATISPVSPLAKFIEEIASMSNILPLPFSSSRLNSTCINHCISALTPAERAKHLAETKLFENAHIDAATLGQTAIPTDVDTDMHFITFIQGASGEENGGMRLVELDGRREGPVDHGPSEDLLKVRPRPVFRLSGNVSLNESST